MASERTPLRSGPSDQTQTYVFMTNSGRAHRNKIRQFQCCVCAAILGVFVTALIITISYSVEHDDEDNNSTTPMPPQNLSLRMLLTSSWPIPDADPPPWPAPDVAPGAVRDAMSAGRLELSERALLETRTSPLQADTPSYRANQAVKTGPEALAAAHRGALEERATLRVLHDSKHTLNWTHPAGRGPRLHDEDASCAEEDLPLPCPATPYRSADGTCNNLKHPRTWGVAMRPFRRVLPAAYEDGMSKPRSTGLPSAREVSVTIHRPLYRDDPDFTVMLAVWGQFMDHDITATALSQRSDGSAISCCGKQEQHPECLPVRLAAGDPYFHKYNVTCMEFVRSAPAPTCSLGPREQLNQATSFLDGSVVYGPSAALMGVLRASASGGLKMSAAPDGRELLPVSDDPNDGCNREEMNKKGRYCFMSGDARANENLHLTTLHLLWARQHNRLSERLHRMNPHWSGEKVFQESRRIVAAQIQHITYKEFLPIILGTRLVAHLDLSPKESGYYTGYDQDVDPTVCNSFAASSFRFAHTLLPGLLKLIGNDTSSPEFVELHEMLFDPYRLYARDGADRALRGAMETGIERADNFFNPELTQRLFARYSGGHPACGLDLVSLNVQRGRDHGLPPYPAWREHCGYPRPRRWEDLDGIIDDQSLQRMKEIYESVDDVDVYTGSLSEYPVDGGLLGETVTCMLTDQFVRLKRGDRFWYETDEKPQAFTPAQLAEIRKTSLAGIICGTSDGVNAAQPEVMRRPHGKNARVPCSQLPRANLRAWIERDGRFVRSRADMLPLTNRSPPTSTKDDDNVPDELVLVEDQTSFSSEGDIPSTARAVRVRGQVVSGSAMTLSGSSLWSGSLPAVLPVPYFSASRGVVLEGSLVSTGDSATLKGDFSVSEFSPGPGSFTPSDVIRGRLNVQFRVIWETSLDGMIDLSGTFRSPIYLHSTQAAGGEMGASARTSLPRDTSKSALYAPVILDGRYSDNKTFIWNGNFTLVLPTRATPEEEVAFQEDSPNTVYSTLKSNAAAPSKVRVVAEVLSGTLTSTSNGVKSTWWNGSFPVAIPTSPFDKRASSGSEGKPTNRSAIVDGVLWSATISPTSSPSLARLMGKFKMPRFIHGASNFGPVIEWVSGSFSLDLRLLRPASLDALIAPDRLMTARIVFQSDDSSTPTYDGGNPLLQLAAVSQEVVNRAKPVHIILKGSLSPDHSSLFWSGKVLFIFPLPEQEVPPSMKLLQNPLKMESKPLSQRSSGMVKMAARVKSGSVTAAREDGTIGESQVWNGLLPLAITIPSPNGKMRFAIGTPAEAKIIYAHGIVWKGSLSSSTASMKLEGTYSCPRYTSLPMNRTGFKLEWWNGTFSFIMEPLWFSEPYNNVIDFSKTYTSPVYFKTVEENRPLDESVNLDTQYDRPVAAFVAASMEDIADALRAPIILQGKKSATDSSSFEWNGNVIISFPRRYSPSLVLGAPAPSIMTAPSTPERRMGIRVTTGSIYAYPEGAWFWRTWWSGYLPASIPVPIFDSYKSEYAPYPKGPVYHACGLEWTGSIKSVSPTEVKLEGKFSMPHYQHSPTGLSIIWYYGTFSFRAELLWNSPVEDLLVDGGQFTSHIFFRPRKDPAVLRYPVTSSSIPSSLQFLMDSQGAQDGAVRVPVVLDGAYSEDHSAFIWSGDAVLSIQSNLNAATPKILQATPVERKSSDASIKTKKTDSVKPVKPPKPPKLRVGGNVIGGFVNASLDGSSYSTIWSGAVPMWLPSPPFGVVSYSVSQAITWSASLQYNSTDKTVLLSGTFTMPIYENGPSSALVMHTWRGNFEVKVQLQWNPVIDVGAWKETSVYSSKVIYVPKTSSTAANVVPALLLGLSGDEKVAPIILQGSYSFWWNNWFWWTGTVSVGLPLETSSDNAPLTEKLGYLATGKTKEMQKAAFAVVQGRIEAQKTQQLPKSLIWSGALPVAIPSSTVDNIKVNDSVNHSGFAGVISWSADSVVDLPSGEAVINGTFRFPMYRNPQSTGDKFSVEWWTGAFSLQVRQIGDTSVVDLISNTERFSSPIIFKEMTSDETIASLLDPSIRSGTVNDQQFLTASDALADEAVRAPIVLQGSYSLDHSSFIWTGNAVLETYSAPSTKKKFLKKLKSTVLSKAEDKTIKIGARVVSGTVSALGDGNDVPSTIWSGSFPAGLPLAKNFSKSIHGVIWSGSLISTSTNTATLSGEYSAPHIDQPTNNVRWWRGNFSLTLELLWNTTVDGLVSTGTKYSSPVYYHLRNATEESGMTARVESNQLAALSAEELVGAERAPLFLDGFISEDESAFLWSGKMIVVFHKRNAPLPVPSLRAQQSGVVKVPRKRRTSVGVALTSGSLTPSIWGGILPVQIPVAAVRRFRPFTWMLSEVHTDPAGSVSAKGTYFATLPHRKSDDVLTESSMMGSFFFSGDLLWSNAPIGSLMPVGANYSSAIYLKESMSLGRMKAAQDSLTGVWDRTTSEENAVADPTASRAPIILQGKFSDDGEVFNWSGFAVVAFPTK